MDLPGDFTGRSRANELYMDDVVSGFDEDEI
jgi:hypothetical protein